MVYAAMQDVVSICLSHMEHEITRFPNFAIATKDIMKAQLEGFYNSCCDAVRMIIHSQRSFINVWHPDFVCEVKDMGGSSETRNKTPPTGESVSIRGTDRLLFSQAASKERDMVKLSRNLLTNYMKIVARDVEDIVPKMTMSLLVEPMLEAVHTALTSGMTGQDLASGVLQISEQIVEERTETKRALEMLDKLDLEI